MTHVVSTGAEVFPRSSYQWRCKSHVNITSTPGWLVFSFPFHSAKSSFISPFKKYGRPTTLTRPRKWPLPQNEVVGNPITEGNVRLVIASGVNHGHRTCLTTCLWNIQVFFSPLIDWKMHQRMCKIKVIHINTFSIQWCLTMFKRRWRRREIGWDPTGVETWLFTFRFLLVVVGKLLAFGFTAFTETQLTVVFHCDCEKYSINAIYIYSTTNITEIRCECIAVSRKVKPYST